jgi:hypothetical protein
LEVIVGGVVILASTVSCREVSNVMCADLDMYVRGGRRLLWRRL